MPHLSELIHAHWFQGLVLTILGIIAGWLLGRWRRHKLYKQVRGGDARDVVSVEKVLVKELPDGRRTMRIRSCGIAATAAIFTNQIALEQFHKRSVATTSTNPLLDLHDDIGSYILYLLQPWVCGIVGGGPYPHDVWVMCPVCEPGLLSSHQSTTVVLVRQKDLALFRDWNACKQILTERTSDGARVLTLWHMAREFDRQLAEVRKCREAGKPAMYVETMYVLDLAIDTAEAELPTAPVRWPRFAETLKELSLS